MKKFIIAVICTVIMMSVLLTGCSGTEPSQSLSIGVLPDVDSIPLIIAEEKGYFDEEGLDLTIEKFTSAPDRDSALQSGSVDGAVSDILAAGFFADGGFDVVITSMTNGSYKLLAGAGMSGSTDLSGKSIAISTNTIIEFATDQMLAKIGLNGDDVEKTAIPKIPVRLEMLGSGQVDAATLPEPLASLAVQNGASVLDSTDQLGINPGVLLFTKEAVEDKSAELNAFYRAYNKAAEYLQSAPISDYIDILIEKSGFPEGIEDVLTLPGYTSAALPSKTDFDMVMAWLTDKDLIDNVYSYDDLVDNSFVK